MREMVKRVSLLFVALCFTVLLAMPTTTVFAENDKVTICHSTQPNPSSGGGGGPQNNPYVKESVSLSAVDGNAGNSNGNQPDHFANHNGPLFVPGTNQNYWGDIIPPTSAQPAGLNWTTAGQAIYRNDCNVPENQKVTPAAVTFTAPTCETLGTYTIPTSTGVDYKIGGITQVAGSYPAANGSTITVTAVAQYGYELQGKTSWTYTFTAPQYCKTVVTPTAPTFVAPTCDEYGTFTIPSTTGVFYKVDGKVVRAGTYDVEDGTTITVTAHAKYGYELTGKTSWTYTFTAATNCEQGNQVVVPAAVTFTAPTCSAKGSYTIPSQTGVIYQVGGVTKAAGTYTADDGTTVTVTALAADGYVLQTGATNSWTNIFTAATNCGHVLGEGTTTPSTPSTTSFTPQTLSTSTTTPASLPSTGSRDMIYGAMIAAIAGFAVLVSVIAKSAFVKLS